jgi:NAD(P)-dependent dehydrogenase (short-subunit alcohol dehydrogenase family)
MNGKVVFVTGGNAGIGLATALAFAKEGVHVAILGRREDENAKARHLVEAEGVRCLAFAGDVTRAQDVAAAVSRTADTLGGLNFAFNNAGVEQVPTPLPEQTEQDYGRVMDVNVRGVWLCMQHEAPLIHAAGGGCIVNTSSVAGLIGMSGIPLYVAAKHAVIGLTKAVALEYAQLGVRVNAVCPGAVKTDLYERFTGKNPEMETAIEGMHPMGRSGTPEEVASAVVYLCRDATWTTGQALVMDGGFTTP